MAFVFPISCPWAQCPIVNRSLFQDLDQDFLNTQNKCVTHFISAYMYLHIYIK